jgi:hypothetical protein
MNYANYNQAIIERYKVKLTGWTYPRFVSPAEISTVAEIWTLRDALKCGACRWIRLNKQEVLEHAADVENRRANGEQVGKPRKPRNDKGVKRKRLMPVEENDGDNADKREGGSRSALSARSKGILKMSNAMPPKSKPMISDEESDEESTSD